jgi:integral membrane protein
MRYSDVGWFRLAAIAEAISWTGLLIGMAFKYGITHDAIGVHLFGPIHGALFVAFLVAVFRVRRSQGWSRAITFIALASSVPPFGSVLFERWATRTGRLAESARVAVSG